MTDTQFAALVERDAREYDRMLLEALRRKLGNPSLTIDDVMQMRDRIVRFIQVGQELERWHIDGEPFLEVYGPVLNVDGTVIHLRRDYRFIAET